MRVHVDSGQLAGAALEDDIYLGSVLVAKVEEGKVASSWLA